MARTLRNTCALSVKREKFFRDVAGRSQHKCTLHIYVHKCNDGVSSFASTTMANTLQSKCLCEKKNADKAFSVKQNLHLTIPNQNFKIIKCLIITSLQSLIAKRFIDQTLRNKDCHTSWRSYNRRFRPDWTYWFYGEQGTVKIRDNEKIFTKVRK